MIVLGVIGGIIGVIMLFISFCLWLSRKELAENKTDYYGRMILFLIIGLAGIGSTVYSFTSVNSHSYNNTPTYNKTYQSHECYVCGKDAQLKYGSHYYCNTHWAMVKTIDEVS